MANGKHMFPKKTGLDKALELATKNGGVLSAGNFINTNHAVKRDLELQLVQDSSAEQDWFSKGCYNKPKRKPVQRMSQALKKDLEEMFQRGLQTNAKVSAIKAVAYLKELRSPDGRLKYSHNFNNVNGPPPDEKRVKQYFSSLSVKQKKGPLDKGEKAPTIKALEALLDERNIILCTQHSRLFKISSSFVITFILHRMMKLKRTILKLFATKY